MLTTYLPCRVTHRYVVHVSSREHCCLCSNQCMIWFALSTQQVTIVFRTSHTNRCEASSSGAVQKSSRECNWNSETVYFLSDATTPLTCTNWLVNFPVSSFLKHTAIGVVHAKTIVVREEVALVPSLPGRRKSELHTDVCIRGVE